MKRNSVGLVRSNVTKVDYTEFKATGEPCLVFYYSDNTKLAIRLTKEERDGLKKLSDYIVTNYNNSDYKGMVEDKREVFDVILNKAIQKELVLASYDPDYFGKQE